MLKLLFVLGVSAALVGCSSGDNSSTSTSGSAGSTSAGSTSGSSATATTTGGSGSGTTSGGSSGGSTGSSGACSIVGNFMNTLPGGGTANITATGTADAGTFVISIVFPSSTTTIDGNYTVSGTAITMTNTSATPSTVNGCIGEAAVYNLVWTTDCGQVTFHKVSDTCTGRIGDADGNTLTRQ